MLLTAYVSHLRLCVTFRVVAIHTDFLKDIDVAATAVTQRRGPFFLLHEALFVDKMSLGA